MTISSDGVLAPIAELTAQEICTDSLIEKYAKGKEASAEDVRLRVARALAQAEPEDRRAHWEKRFLAALEDGFIPAGRINSAAGIAAHKPFAAERDFRLRLRAAKFPRSYYI